MNNQCSQIRINIDYMTLHHSTFRTCTPEVGLGVTHPSRRPDAGQDPQAQSAPSAWALK
ncbi:hypothetical protein [Pseudoalteromonas aurantia]|uniref:Orphan protein n=1 Tax=Pseudoalteromonas aurantia 208 TaxID=1314867 RepID=A0ABR9EHE5_9GAMM|nr:hypothetical protein [Pseudoalteromonas aurantia]MBE0370252.1 hypothetical protein [Pseudoalteromonas aurantia 208]